MRLHHLEITAFGPFADTVRVDFADLSAAGLFLLTGPTGSGKTSVLDAVCFALYGAVPGDRALAKQLRSDHAPAGRAPVVTLECTLGGRRLRVRRSPAWQRPKRRGSGVTTEQAHVTLSEQIDGAWSPVSTRLDEVGHLLGELLGMSLGQFTQVAMLPQGDFQAFLRASADERQRLLEKLFHTERFRQVESWLGEQRRDLARQVAGAESEVDQLVSRAAEALDAPTPGGGERPTSHEVRAWLTLSAEDLTERLADTRSLVVQCNGALARSRDSLLEAERVAERRARAADLRDRLARLDERAEANAADRSRLTSALRAAPVEPLLALVSDAEQSRNTAAARSLRDDENVRAVLPPDTPDLATARARMRDDLANARALKPDEQELAMLHAAERTADIERERVVAELARAQATVDETPELLTAAHADLREREEATALLPAARTTVERLESQLAAHARACTLQGRLDEARAHVQEVRAEVQQLRQAWLDIREARLNGMAAEIAGGLAVGAECPVCGSCSHPHPASARSGAPDAAAERAARAAVDTTEAAEVVARDHERGLTTQLAVARSEAGDLSADELAPQLEAAQREAGRLAELAQGTAHCAGRLQHLRERRDRAHASMTSLTGRAEAIEAEARHRAARRLTIEERISAVLIDGAADSLDALITSLSDVVARCDRAIESAAATTRAQSDLDAARRRLSDAVETAGFADVNEASEAVLPEEQRSRLDTVLRQYADERAAVTAALAEDDLEATTDLPDVDLDALRAQIEIQQQESSAADRQVAILTRRQERLTILAAEVATALDALVPLSEKFELVRAMAAFAEGKSADNRLAMRLSAYALAFRLRQVVDAANERLAAMSDQRYTLEHTAERGARDPRGGLTLLVRDAWSGESRHPATLSGGETFIVSLALALGLSDVVTHEAAGAELGTLFVDEGFGSLDPETLDHVLDTLDELRSGGRVVGIVSHVAEVRDRISARLVVTKAQSGSTLTQIAADA